MNRTYQPIAYFFLSLCFTLSLSLYRPHTPAEEKHNLNNKMITLVHLLHFRAHCTISTRVLASFYNI